MWADAAAGKWPGFTVSHIAGVAADYDGIVVHGQYTPGLNATATATLAASATVETGVTVRVEAGEPATLDVATRSNDFAPFNSGGYMLGSSGHVCTSGFSIWLSGATHITTARHCTDSSYHARNGTASYGRGVRNSGDGAAKVLSGTGSGLMFDGAWNDSTGYHKNVDSLAGVGLNSVVCMSGGNSGIHCGIKVDNMRVSFNDGQGSFSTIHGTQQNSGQIASMQGDSGGPVITLAGTGRVHAVGMDQGHDLGVSSCGSAHDAGSNTCGRGIFFTSMRTIINSMSGSSLVTS